MILDQIRKSLKNFMEERGIRKVDVAKGTGTDVRTVRNFIHKGKGNLTTVDKIFRYFSEVGWDYSMAVPVPVCEEVSAGNGREICGKIVQTIFVPFEFHREGMIAIKVRG